MGGGGGVRYCSVVTKTDTAIATRTQIIQPWCTALNKMNSDLIFNSQEKKNPFLITKKKTSTKIKFQPG